MLAAVVAVALGAAPATAQDVPDWVNRMKISGLAFGDYAWMAASHDPEMEGNNAFWFRRIYLTFDYGFSQAWDFRLRFEANSAGDFTSSKIEPFVKDAWVRWKNDRHAIYIGLSSTPTWDLVEGFWGYRDVEKTALDLQKMGSSRDLGVAAKGKLDEGGRVEYHAMIGNGSGTKGETNEGKKALLGLAVHPTDELVIQVYGDVDDRPGDTDRTTVQAFAGWEGDDARLGVQFAHQNRQREEEASLDLDVLSVFGAVDVSERVALLARYDRMFDPNPDAAAIAYLPMDPTAKSNLLLGGIDIELDAHFHLIPNLEVVFYDDVSGLPKPDTDVVPRVTFSAKF